MNKTISDMKLFNLRQKGYASGPHLADLLEYCQHKNMKVKLMSMTLIDPDLIESLYRAVRDSLK